MAEDFDENALAEVDSIEEETGESENSPTEEKHEMTFEEAQELIRQNRPFLFVMEDMIRDNSQALYDMTLLSGWCDNYEAKCTELEIPNIAENFKFMATLLEQAARGLMDVMYKTQLQPELPVALRQSISEGKGDMTYSDYKQAVEAENPVEFTEDVNPAALLTAMHSNLERAFAVVANAAQQAVLDGPAPLHDFYLIANANPLVAVATASAVVDRTYQMGAFGPEYWIFLPNEYRDTWRGTNLSRIKHDELGAKFRIPCSLMHISEIPGIPADDSIPLETFANGQWAHLHDQLVTEYYFKSISEWIKAVK